MMRKSSETRSASACRPLRPGRLLRAAVLVVSFASPTVIGACADDNTARSGSSEMPRANADIVGGGGRVGEIYREITRPAIPAGRTSDRRREASTPHDVGSRSNVRRPSGIW